MNEFIRSAAEKMTANYMKCEFFQREGDKTLPDEKTIEGITRQFMVIAKNNLNAIFELDNEVQKMLTK